MAFPRQLPENAIPRAGIQVASRLMIIGPTVPIAPSFVPVWAVHRNEVELAVEVHDNDAVAALFALVIMDLSRSDLPPGSAGWIIRHSYPVGGCLRLA